MHPTKNQLLVRGWGGVTSHPMMLERKGGTVGAPAINPKGPGAMAARLGRWKMAGDRRLTTWAVSYTLILDSTLCR